MPKTGRVYVTQSISFPPELLTEAKQRAQNLGLSFSSYVQKCLEKDLSVREAMVLEERASPKDGGAKKKRGYPVR
jgi:hypothetical protein